MISYNEAIAITNEKNLVQAVCLSTDAKPTTGIANGSTLIEMDTSKTYMFNEEDGEWVEVSQGGGGGGGGSSDFTFATVTIENNLEDRSIYLPNIMNDDELGYLVSNIAPLDNGANTFICPLYKGQLVFSDQILDDINDAIGDIWPLDDAWLITGECTIVVGENIT